MQKKHDQLGMNAGTASHRLVKDLLFSFIQQAGIKCWHCGGALTRDDFSIEHKTPWLDSENPVGLYFDLDNISYSHRRCNFSAARKSTKIYGSKAMRNAAYMRRAWAKLSPAEQRARRQDKYQRYGC